MDNKLQVNFKDVQKNAWYYPYVAATIKDKLIAGYPDNTFRGTKTIIKSEIITVNASVLNNKSGFYYPKDTKKYIKYEDAGKIPEWFKKHLVLATREGIIPQRSDGTYRWIKLVLEKMRRL